MFSGVISFVIVTWNCLEHMDNLMHSLIGLDLKQEFETLIIDANSTDGTTKYLEELRNSKVADVLGLRLFLFNEKYSYSYNNQFGIRQAKGDWLVISNPDIIFNHTFLPFLEESQSIQEGIFTCQLIDRDGTPQEPVILPRPWSIFFVWTTLGTFLNFHIARRRLRYIFEYHDTASYGKMVFVEHPQASLFMIPRRTLQRLNNGLLFRKSFTWFCSDTDWFTMALSKSIPVYYYTNTKIVHARAYAARKHPRPITSYEIAYGSVLYARYWRKRPWLVELLWIVDGIMRPFIFSMTRHPNVRQQVKASSAIIQGLIRARNLKLV
jgi:GT2 family glycosyltransferase